MRKTWVVLAAVAMSMTVMPTITAHEDPPIPPGLMDTMWFGEQDHQGNGAIVREDCPSSKAVTVTSLFGLAPQQTLYCTSGSHNTAIYYVTHGPDMAAISGFTGTIESVISHESGARRWQCDFVNGAWQSPCRGSGVWMGAANRPFCHDVWAFNVKNTPGEPVPAVGAMGYAANCPNGAAPDLLGTGLRFSANSKPVGSGAPTGTWAAYEAHA